MWNFSTSIKISPLSHQVFVYSFLQVQTFLSWWQYDCIHHQEIWIFLFLLQHWQGRMKRTPTTNISKHALCLMLVMFVTLIFFITLFTTCNVILSPGPHVLSSSFTTTDWRPALWSLVQHPVPAYSLTHPFVSHGQGLKRTHAVCRKYEVLSG